MRKWPGKLQRCLIMAVKQLTRKEKERAFLAKREIRIRKSRRSFWEYCQTESPDFYKPVNWHLHLFCWVLQAFYERQLTKAAFQEACQEIAPAWYYEQFDWDWLEDERIYKSLIINIPPRHGKSRTLVLFCQWVLGTDSTNKIITCSYNDDQATEFSRFTRDGIAKVKGDPHEIAFQDIFPGVEIARGNASYMKWALEGHFFNYKGAGIGGSITGKGGSLVIVDDPIKDAEAALNSSTLEKIWNWYSGTFLSRKEEGGLEIINHTRWSKQDICGKVLEKSNKKKWFVIKMEAKTGEHMLCPEMLSEESYKDLEINILPEIFRANYHQEPIDAKGRLYTKFKTYVEPPRDPMTNEILFEEIISYVDTADQGSDFLSGYVAGVFQGQGYILDVIYSREAMEHTEPQTAKMLYENEVNRAKIESNNGGRGFARQVETILWNSFKSRETTVEWFHQSQNKRARILTNANWVMTNIYMPVNWQEKWPDLAAHLNSYQKEGKNAHDDGADALTGIAEMIREDTGLFIGRV